jgi:hypothetical protein
MSDADTPATGPFQDNDHERDRYAHVPDLEGLRTNDSKRRLKYQPILVYALSSFVTCCPARTVLLREIFETPRRMTVRAGGRTRNLITNLSTYMRRVISRGWSSTWRPDAFYAPVFDTDTTTSIAIPRVFALVPQPPVPNLQLP